MKKTMQNHRHVLIALVRQHKWTRGVELGVFRGQTLVYLLNRFPDLRMIGVDTWERTTGPKEPDRNTGVAAYDKDMEGIYANARAVCGAYSHRCELIRARTAETAARFADGQFDFVFVDADHTAESVEADVRAWMPKIKPGGAMIGHDANWPSVQRGLAAALGSGWANLSEGNCWIWWRP